MPNTIFETSLKTLPLIHRGKVRDIYDVDARHMLIVATDRISAFDVVLPTPIPNKGVILTSVSNFWFNRFRRMVPSQLSDMTVAQLGLPKNEAEQLEGRAVIVKRLKALPVEAIVRGYLIGSGWKEYQAKQAVCGISLPGGIPLAGKLPETLFTPSTKADVGQHDQNISFAETAKLVGIDVANQIRTISLKIYENAAEYALSKGIIIADTKLEFGVDNKGNLTLIDELLTPDSSRFWPAASYVPGQNPRSFDKQYIRDYLETLDWNKKPPGPGLPEEIIRNTQAKYQEAADRLLQK